MRYYEVEATLPSGDGKITCLRTDFEDEGEIQQILANGFDPPATAILLERVNRQAWRDATHRLELLTVTSVPVGR